MSNGWLGEYTTQLGPDGLGHERCWAATLASCLLHFGWASDPYGLTLDVWRLAGGKTRTMGVDDLRNLASSYGVHTDPWYNWPEAMSAVNDQQCVIALVNNRLLVPRAYPFGAEWEALHYIRLVMPVDNDQLWYCYDPLCYKPQPDGRIYQGPNVYTRESLSAAIMANSVQEAGIVLTMNRTETPGQSDQAQAAGTS